jgi:hypothetical protein
MDPLVIAQLCIMAFGALEPVVATLITELTKKGVDTTPHQALLDNIVAGKVAVQDIVAAHTVTP